MTAQSSSTQARHGMTTDNEVLLEVKGLCVDYAVSYTHLTLPTICSV